MANLDVAGGCNFVFGIVLHLEIGFNMPSLREDGLGLGLGLGGGLGGLGLSAAGLLGLGLRGESLFGPGLSGGNGLGLCAAGLFGLGLSAAGLGERVRGEREGEREKEGRGGEKGDAIKRKSA